MLQIGAATREKTPEFADFGVPPGPALGGMDPALSGVVLTRFAIRKWKGESDAIPETIPSRYCCGVQHRGGGGPGPGARSRDRGPEAYSVSTGRGADAIGADRGHEPESES